MIIVVGGIILFLAVFVGIQIGYALKGGDRTSATEAISSGTPSPGDPVPSLKLFTEDGRPSNLREIVSGGDALIAFTMSGCSSCSDLLSGWKADGILDRREGRRIFVVVATPPGDFDAGELAPYASYCPMYFCDNADLYVDLDVHGLPAVLGVTGDGAVSFFSDDAESIRDTTYLVRHR